MSQPKKMNFLNEKFYSLLEETQKRSDLDDTFTKDEQFWLVWLQMAKVFKAHNDRHINQ